MLTKIQMEFVWKGENPKIKNSTVCNGYEYGGLKNVDTFSKVKFTMLFYKKVIW